MNVARWSRSALPSLGRLEAVEAAVLALAFPLYYLVRGSVHARVTEAFRHSTQIAGLEQRLHIFQEARLEQWVLPYEGLVRFLNLVYVWGHLPLIVALAVWLYFRRRETYLLMRNAFLISGGIGLVIFSLYPVAPPRMLPEFGFVDTVTLLDPSSRSLQPSFFVNQYAAMPSLHFGWNLLVGVALWMATRHLLLRAIGLASPAIMGAAIVLTGNHYFLDMSAGLLVAGTGLATAAVLRSSGGRCFRSEWIPEPLWTGYCWLTGFGAGLRSKGRARVAWNRS